MGGTGRSVRCLEVLKNVLVGYFIIRPALFQPDQNVIRRTGNLENSGKVSEKKDRLRGENKQTYKIQRRMTKSEVRLSHGVVSMKCARTDSARFNWI